MKLLILLFFIFIFLYSCNRNTYEFSKADLRFVESFNKIDTLIFFSKLEKKDTIIFGQVKKQKVNPRSFPLGYENSFYLKVGYELTKGSYHKLVSGSDEINTNNLISFSVTPPSTDFKHLFFIGSLFDIEKIDSRFYENVAVIEFFEKDAKEILGFALNKWVSYIKFSFNEGIICYEDNDGTRWQRLINTPSGAGLP